MAGSSEASETPRGGEEEAARPPALAGERGGRGGESKVEGGAAAEGGGGREGNGEGEGGKGRGEAAVGAGNGTGTPDADARPPPPPAPRECCVCEAPAKYTCPACGARTCSLPCVTEHKRRTGCTGKRDRAAYVGRREFDERTLRSDLVFLEEAQSLARGAANALGGRGRGRGRGVTQGGGRGGRGEARGHGEGLAASPSADAFPSHLPHRLRTLWQAARDRGVALRFAPEGLSRRRANSTVVEGGGKGELRWRIEWKYLWAQGQEEGGDGDEGEGERTETRSRVSTSASASVPASTSASPSPPASPPAPVLALASATARASERQTVARLARAALRARPWPREARRAGAKGGPEDCAVFLRVEGRPGPPRWRPLRPDATLAESLAGTVVFEFPTLALCLAGQSEAVCGAEGIPIGREGEGEEGREDGAGKGDGEEEVGGGADGGGEGKAGEEETDGKHEEADGARAGAGVEMIDREEADEAKVGGDAAAGGPSSAPAAP